MPVVRGGEYGASPGLLIEIFPLSDHLGLIERRDAQMGVLEKQESVQLLVKKVASGDEVAKNLLAFEIRDAITLKLSRLGLPQIDVEDLAQDCTIEILRRIETFDLSRGSLDAWMSGFAKNAFRMWARSSAVRKAQYQADLSDEPAYEIAEMAEPRAALASALESVAMVDRELLFMRFSLGLSSEEIARNTTMNPAQVRKRISRAVEKLRNHPSIQRLVA